MIKRASHMAVVATLATACATFAMADEPKNTIVLKPDVTDTLAGVDANKDGIRDDVETYISSRFAGKAEQVAALRQLARSMQRAILFDGTKPAAKAISLKVGKAIHCVSDKMPTMQDFGQAVTVIESISANTKLRKAAYADYNKALDGTVSSLPEGNTCE